MKMYYIEDYQVGQICELFTRKNDNEYIVLCSNGQVSDIAQYTDKYQNVHIVSVPISKLDTTKRLY